MILWIVLFVVVAVLAYVRLAPSDPVRWHTAAAPAGTQTQKMDRGLIWRKTVEGDATAELAALAAQAEKTPRTTHLAGSVEEGQVTYVTRSKMMGFPDYTTMGVYAAPDGSRYLEVYGRLRFGRSDLGVNAKRIKGWVAAANL